jgi:hypothetical protein
MYVSNNESGEVYRNVDVTKLKNCTGVYEKNRETIKQSAKSEIFCHPSSFLVQGHRPALKQT